MELPWDDTACMCDEQAGVRGRGSGGPGRGIAARLKPGTSHLDIAFTSFKPQDQETSRIGGASLDA